MILHKLYSDNMYHHSLNKPRINDFSQILCLGVLSYTSD